MVRRGSPVRVRKRALGVIALLVPPSLFDRQSTPRPDAEDATAVVADPDRAGAGREAYELGRVAGRAHTNRCDDTVRQRVDSRDGRPTAVGDPDCSGGDCDLPRVWPDLDRRSHGVRAWIDPRNGVVA